MVLKLTFGVGSVRVIPSGVDTIHPAHAGPFVLLRFPSAAPIVHVEAFQSTAFLYGSRDVAAHERAVEQLQHAALNDAESVELIADIARKYDN